jgi:hypothetical protein
MLTGPGFGSHIETAVDALRMGGGFDRFPKLQIVIGIWARGLPFLMQRVDVMLVELTQLTRPDSAHLRDNLRYTFAGFSPPHTQSPLIRMQQYRCPNSTLGIRRGRRTKYIWGR